MGHLDCRDAGEKAPGTQTRRSRWQEDDDAKGTPPRASPSPDGGGSGRRRGAPDSGASSSSSPPARRPPQSPVPAKFAHRRTSSEVWRCKKGKRTDIKPSEWGKHGYAAKAEVLTQPITYDSQTVPIPRVKRADITPSWFFENVASKHRPIIVEGACSDWPAMHRWSLDAMEERFSNVAFKVAKDDNGKKLRMKFKYYADYVRRQADDSPLYLFETNVNDNGYIRPLMEDYTHPDIFPHDWLGLVNEDARPPYRWFCIGPKRSGTTVHTDPLGTSAWNALTHGCKRWVLFDPSEQRKVVKGRDVIQSDEEDEAIQYFDFILPRIKRAHPELKVYEGFQNPGDIIFVPGDWWHGVLNVQDTVAVTENYCGPDNFDLVWKRTRREREKVAYLWLRNMKRFAPKLYDRAVSMNKRDSFRMRHERPKGERLSDASSSSSESSSDSSSDCAADLEPRGLEGVAPPGTDFGPAAFRKQGGPAPKPSPSPGRSAAKAHSHKHRHGSPRKRRRVTE